LEQAPLPTAPLRLLIVDDSGPDRFLMRTALSHAHEAPYEIFECGNADEAEQLANSQRLDGMLIDIRLPGKDGITLLEQLAKRMEDVAFLVITGQGDEEAAVRALKAGAADYLVKDHVLRHATRLDRAVRDAVYGKRLERENHRLMKTLRERNLELERLNRQLWEMSHTDSLTGFYNRRFITTRLEEEIARSHRYHLPLSVVLADLDNFKSINDRYGHLVGDEVLKNVGKQFRAGLRDTDLVGRYGGEEFLLILTNTSSEGAGAFCNRLRDSLERSTITTEEKFAIHLTASFGVAGYTFGSETAEDMVRMADQNLYVAKRQGRNRVVLGQPAICA
jgi:two-component system chemotaxis family response regulator WspR